MNNIVELINKLPQEKREVLEKQLKIDGSKYNVFPLSFAQKRLWFLDRFEANKSVYNIPSAYKITGKLDYEILEKAVNAIINRHEILRTIFIVVDQEPFQVVNSDVKINIPIIDLTNAAEQEEKIREILFNEASQHFNLSEGPLLSVKLIKTAEDRHIVSLTMHHIISDGWSMSILIREVIALYNSFAQGKPSPLPPLKIQYADFAKWQNDYMQGEKFDEQLNYWKEKLEEIPQAIDLPFDKPRPPHQTHNGDHLRFGLSKDLSKKLADLARDKDVTLFMLMLAAFDVLLSKYSGQDDIVVGTPIAGRNRPETENLIGFFINTLVLRTKLDGNPTFEELLEQVKETALGAFANQDLPFEKLIEAVQPERNLNVPPIFQVLFTFQNLPMSKVKVAELEFEPVNIDNKTVKYDLTLSLEETPEGIRGGFGYNTDLFEKETIERLSRHFGNLLESIVSKPGTRISDLEILDENEKTKILYQWNKTEKEYNLKVPIHKLFEEQVEKTPDNTAIVQPPNSAEEIEAKNITYSKLNNLSNKIANYIVSKGIEKGSVIGICYDRKIEQIALVFGILKAGCAYLPLDTKYPEERIKYMVEDSKAKIVFTQSKYENKFGGNIPLIFLDSALDEIDAMAESVENIDVQPDDLAYIIYTSGSTGKPKGVAVEHGNLVNYIYSAKENFAVNSEDKVLQFASISFDAAAEEIYPALTSGAELVLRNDMMIGSAFSFINTISELGITVLDLPTAYWHQLVSEMELTNTSFPEKVRLVIIGGERAIPSFVQKWQKKYSKIKLLNTYGPTETTVVATLWELPPLSDKPPFINEVPIGKPISNVKAYILDKYLNPVPIGVGGELHIGGAGVARGYLNRAELTSEKFIANPFDSSFSGRLYKTGDKVKYLKDGTIEFLGRLDKQVKVRGFRIELGEIENEINKHSAVKEAVLNIIENPQGEKSLVAYFTSKESVNIGGLEIKKYLQKSLPDYMIPSFFVKVDKIPLTPTGKVDFKSLPDPSGSRPDLEKPFIEARNPLEKLLTEIWKRTLQIDKIGVHDNFFELGGDSLKAAILINRLQQELDIILYVVVLFDNQNIAALANYLAEKYPEKVLDVCKKYYPDDNYDFIKTKTQVKIYEINESKIEEAERILSSKTRDKDYENEFLKNLPAKLKRAIFILSAPRSGSTLLRVILAGHPKLFSPPELALLNFRTLKERAETFAGRDEGWMEGLFRAIMEIKNCDFEKAKKIVREFEKLNFTTYQMYEKLQEWIGDRILVDKTTTYASNIDYLNRAEYYFDEPFYIQIVRHPSAMIQSYLDSNLEQVFGSELPYEAREKAELFWIINNRNIFNFFKQIPEERKSTIKYEDMVRNPEKVIRELCEKIGIEYEPEMIHPYQGNRMLDGVHKESKMVGDPRFNTHKEIDPTLADKWQSLPEGDKLSRYVLQIAEELNYKINPSDKPVRKIPLVKVERKNLMPLSFSQERLWFLDKLDPGNSAYNIPGVVRLKGNLHFKLLKQTIDEIVERHEILRSAITTVEGKAFLHIENNVNYEIELTDISNIAEKAKDEKIKKLVFDEIQKPFKLDNAPLFRVKLIKVKEDDSVLILTMHHAISDGWSVGIFIREFTEIYTSLIEGREPKLPKLEIQYTDYAYWQREYLKGDLLEDKLKFWKEYLEGVPPLIELPTDKPRPAVQTFNGDLFKFTIPENISKQIKDLSKKENATLFMILLGAFQTLLSYYSGQDDIVVGTPVANRNKEELENLIGFFVNTIVFRNDLSENPTFVELLNSIKNETAQVFSHQDVPFEKIIDSLNIERDVSHSPLFQVMFTFQNLPRTKIELPGLELESVELNSKISKFDLSLTMMETGDSKLAGSFEYNTDLFERSTIERLYQHFINLLNLLTRNPLNKVKNLSILTESEKAKLLGEWKGKTGSFPSDSNLVNEFVKAARSFGENIAVEYNGESISYKELDTLSNKLAHYLIKKGVGKESLVGFYLDRSIESIVSIIAVWKAGAAYVPLDPSYPRERIEFMVRDAELKAVITTEKYRANFNTDNLIIIDTEKEIIEQLPGELPQVGISSDNLAYIIYTSGSTGKPKGVMVRHKSVLNLATGLYQIVYKRENGKNLKVSLNAPLAFDASVQQLVALLFGHTLSILPQEIRLDGEGLVNFIRKHKLDVLDCVPTQLRILLENGFTESNEWRPSVVLPGGEPIDNQLWQTLVNIDDVKFYNMYGPTECTVDSTICSVTEKVLKPSIGKPIINSVHFVLDKRMNLVPIGVPGELYIGGESLSRGYLNRPELTAERFLPNPFSVKEGERLYKTGDLVRFMPDGNIEYLGRVDDQVKLRGFRIELGEIESNISKYPLINQTVAIVKKDENGLQKLIAYFTTEDNKEISLSDLRKYLQDKLPDYMIPAVFVRLEEFPKLPNGKINKRALPEPQITRREDDKDFIRPETEKEIKLAKIWEDLLKIKKISVDDNFFELGGDSILGIQIIARAKQVGLKISPLDLFKNQTIRKLALVAKETETVKAEQGLVSGEFPLTPIQHTFFNANYKEPNHWNQSIFLTVKKEFDEEKFKELVKKIIEHHDMLRAKYQKTEKGWKQTVSDSVDELPLVIYDLTDKENPKTEIERLTEQTQKSLDIENGKLIKFAYFKISEKEGRLLIVIHHLVVDGVSWRILVEDLISIFNSLNNNEVVDLPPKTTSFKEWAEYLSEEVVKAIYENEKAYWEKLSTVDIKPIESDYDKGENTEESAFAITKELEAQETELLLKEVPKVYNTQINDILLSALFLANVKWQGRKTLLLHLEGHGREEISPSIDISRTVGWFTSIFPVKLELDETTDKGEVIKSVKEQIRQIPNKGFGFGILRYLSDDEELKNKLSKFDKREITFNYLGQFDTSLPEKSPFGVALENKGTERSKKNNRSSLIDINSGIGNGKLRITFSASSNLFKRESLESLAEQYILSLKELISHCANTEQGGFTKSDFDLIELDDDELDDILSDL